MANNPRKLRPPLISVYDVLDYFAQQKRQRNEEVFCFQVGANDGKSNDPVHPYFKDFGWKGLLVEPQVDVFEAGLTKTYAGNPRVILENVALANTEGELPFYRVAISKARWATGLSSFDKKSLLGHIENGYILRKAMEEGVEIPSDPEKLLEVVKVPTSTVSGLFTKHGVNKIDVLCVDTEGYDYEILKLIDFKKYSPELVLFESKNLSDPDFVAAKRLLTDAGYNLYWEKGDTLALKISMPLFLRCRLKIKALARKL
jgi:FkbM family methyltransferase